MRPFLLAALLAALASPAFAACYAQAVGTVPEEIASQTDALLCQQRETQQDSAAQFRQVQIDAQLQEQQLLIQQQLQLEQQQQLATLTPPNVP
jgi:hypothetical protein